MRGLQFRSFEQDLHYCYSLSSVAVWLLCWEALSVVSQMVWSVQGGLFKDDQVQGGLLKGGWSKGDLSGQRVIRSSGGKFKGGQVKGWSI